MSAATSVDMCPILVVHVLEALQTTSDMVGMLAAGGGLLAGAVMWLSMEARLAFRKGTSKIRCEGLHSIRGWMGRYILLGLEFMIVSDLIHSFLKPDLNSLMQLGLIVVIRTAISFFLGKELEADV